MKNSNIEFFETTDCSVCEGKGYHSGCNIQDGTIGEDINPKTTFVQKCQECSRYSSDWEAASAYANNHHTVIYGVLVEKGKE